jgi:hypothetical protein
MDIANHQRNHELCLARAGELLGVPVCALSLEWNAERLLRQRLRRETRHGLLSELPHLEFTGGPKGLSLEFGLERFRLEIGGASIPLVRVIVPPVGLYGDGNYDFWAVPIVHYRRLYCFLRRIERRSLDAPPPVMRESDRAKLWHNTIGFLRRGHDELVKFGMPVKRGVVLMGEPGNGKTMASRWLLAQCHRHALRWRSITASDYETACQDGTVPQLFELHGPGIVLFDDLDQALRDREHSDAGTRRTTFLTELDGLYPREGCVYLFTSNLRWNELDPAFRRPGRIDLFLLFPRPDASLRRRFITERWHGEITLGLDLDRVIEMTTGLSFAELDEVKKLLVLNYLDTGSWDWDTAWETYIDNHAGPPRRPIGFSAPTAHHRPPAAATQLRCEES